MTINQNKKQKDMKAIEANGGKGSGNFGHSGRPGEVGGSGDGGVGPVGADRRNIVGAAYSKVHSVYKDYEIVEYTNWEKSYWNKMSELEQQMDYRYALVKDGKVLTVEVDPKAAKEFAKNHSKGLVQKLEKSYTMDDDGNTIGFHYVKTSKWVRPEEQTIIEIPNKKKSKRNNNMLSNSSSIINNSYAISTGTYNGKQHLIVPVVMMKEGVHSGSQGPILHKAEELQNMTESWNGIPVVIYHPKNDEGEYISANEPQVQSVGRIFNTRFEDGALKAEVWLESDRLNTISPLAAAYIKEQKALDVSVGVFTKTDLVTGDWHGEEYIGIASNYHPDHLALLPGETGACSWEDGCGIRVNSKQQTNGGKGSGNFGHGGRPGEVGGSGDSARSTAFQEAGMDQEAANDLAFGVERLLKGGYMDIKDAQYIEKLVAKGKYDLATKLVSEAYTDALENNSKQNNNMETHFAINSLQDRKNEYREIVDKVSNKLYSMDNDFAYHYPVEIYDDGFIYLSRNRQSGKETFYQQKYSVDAESGEITFEDEPQKVIRKTNYEVQTNQQNNKNKKGEKPMEKSKCFIGKVDALISNERTHFTEEDREMLMDMEETMLDKLQPKMTRTKVEVNEQVVTDFLKGQSEEQVLKVLPENMQKNYNAMIQEKAQKREAVITAIMAHEKNEWKKEELTAMSCENLSKISKMLGAEVAAPADYSANGGAAIQANVGKSNVEILMPPGTEA